MNKQLKKAFIIFIIGDIIILIAVMFKINHFNKFIFNTSLVTGLIIDLYAIINFTRIVITKYTESSQPPRFIKILNKEENRNKEKD